MASRAHSLNGEKDAAKLSVVKTFSIDELQPYQIMKLSIYLIENPWSL